MEAIGNAGSALGVLAADGVVLVGEKKVTSKLLHTSRSAEKMYKIDSHLACAVAGIMSDANILLNTALLHAQRYALAYQEPIPVEQLVQSLCDTKQGYTQFGGLRPFGVSFLFAGWDKNHGFQLYMSDPSGNYGGWKAAAVGANSQAAQSMLKQDYRDGMTREEAVALALKVLSKTMDSTSLTAEKPPEGAKQRIELRVERVIEVGEVDAAAYPLPKTKLTLENLRDFVHLRARTNTIGAVARIRHQLACATHNFFDENGFLYVHTPIITTSDCEGAGEMFQVTTLFSQAEKVEKELKENPAPSEADIEAAKLLVKEKGDAVAQLKAAKTSKQEISAAVLELTKTKENVSRLEERSKLKPGIPHKDDGTIAFENDFFKRQAFLTVSGQLQVETYACALSSVYTFGPTFRAENSHTSRHLAEFWMVEPEIAFANLQDDMNCAESYVQYLCKWLLEHCREDMELMVKIYDKTAIERLELVSSTPFERISYTKAVEILKSTDKKFENKVEWGIDLASEHERYLTEVIFKKPVIVYNYPKKIKAFYMRLNDDQNTVAAMDVLVPKVGELIGGSQREERLDILKQRILDSGLPLEPYEWYLDLRRFGSVKHSGFGLGFERMILFATGLENIRDVIPFPRYPGRADL